MRIASEVEVNYLLHFVVGCSTVFMSGIWVVPRLVFHSEKIIQYGTFTSIISAFIVNAVRINLACAQNFVVEISDQQSMYEIFSGKILKLCNGRG